MLMVGQQSARLDFPPCSVRPQRSSAGEESCMCQRTSRVVPPCTDATSAASGVEPVTLLPPETKRGGFENAGDFGVSVDVG
jgi:hypothetical protein